MRRNVAIILSLLTILTIIYTTCEVSASWIAITVETDKAIYNVGEKVTVNGTVVFDGQPLTNTLVAIEVDDRTMPILYRTVNTGSDPAGPFKIEILNAFLGDINRNPVTNAKAGSTYWIWIVYKNNEANPVRAGLTFTIIDSTNSPMLALMLRLGDLPTGGPWYDSYQWTIPSDAKLGTATVYGNAYTDYPKNGGIPHCPEKSSTFNIVSSSSTSQSLSSQSVKTTQTSGSYSLNFNIPKTGARLGNYNVYATTFKWDLKDMETTIFTVTLLGDINGDLVVNAKDAVILGRAFGSSQGNPNYNPNADLNKDGQINAKDAIIVGSNFGNSGI
jgi:hypothetical protein